MNATVALEDQAAAAYRSAWSLLFVGLKIRLRAAARGKRIALAYAQRIRVRRVI